MPRLGEILLQTGLITPAQLAQALAQQKVEGGRVGAILIKLGYLTEQQVVQAGDRLVAPEPVGGQGRHPGTRVLVELHGAADSPLRPHQHAWLTVASRTEGKTPAPPRR